MAGLAAFALLLGRRSRRDDVVVGTPMATRDRPEVQGTVGLLLNTLPLRLDLRGVASFREILRRVRETVLDAFMHHDVPFERIVEVARRLRDPGGLPLVQAMFVLHDEPIPLLDLPAVVAERYPIDGPWAKFDLTMSLTKVGSTMAGRLEYNADLFDRTTAVRLCEDFAAICRAAAEDPDRLPEVPDPAPALVDAGGSVPGDMARMAPPRDRSRGPGNCAVPTEAAMASLWAEVLGLPTVDVRDDFFDIGGHSLLALNLLARIRERFGRELPPSALLRRPTVAGLAELLEARRLPPSSTIRWSRSARRGRGPRSSACPASAAGSMTSGDWQVNSARTGRSMPCRRGAARAEVRRKPASRPWPPITRTGCGSSSRPGGPIALGGYLRRDDRL